MKNFVITQKYFLFLLVFMNVLVKFSLASEVEAIFLKGNELYKQGDYLAAISEYEKIATLGFESWEVYYNLGNAYYKDGQLARAILNFERAKKLNPKNEDINFNLEFANLSVVDRIPQLPTLFIFSWISQVANVFNLQTLGIITLSLYLLLGTMIPLRILLKAKSFKKLGAGILIATCILLTFFSSIFIIRIYEAENKIEAIVLVDKVDVKSAPGEAGTDVFTLHLGVKVQLQDQSLNWVKIRLSDGKVGWMKQDQVEKI
ncbi:MAG: tetratricopeptide repeat protein [bacterium]